MSTRSSTNEADERFALRALLLAHRGVALAHPNPIVGAVIVKNGRAVGEGFHEYGKRDHAEIVALKQAGSKARGSTLYVTLEPCCITGRTGPCTQAIISADIRRVVASIPDPNPAVAGKGFAQLRRAGIRVETGACAAEARETNADFAKWIRTGLPFVTLKTALTLDGRIALRPGHSTSITGARARESAQQLRHEADALLTGIGTVLVDDPLLTDRTGQPRRSKLLRVVVDSHLRLPLKSRLVRSARGDVVVFATQPLTSPRARALARAGIDVFRAPARRGRVDLAAVIRELGKRDILNLLIEAGAEVNGAALEANIVDKVALFYAPKFTGATGVPVARMPSNGPSHPLRLTNLSANLCKPDVLIEGYFHDVYRDYRRRRKD
jgi:diaminohydroxyphosphoribosylaminopyrimidine deaminase / 5-amino-6-(5-phosphoribosylamino)uracil reductase